MYNERVPKFEKRDVTTSNGINLWKEIQSFQGTKGI